MGGGFLGPPPVSEKSGLAERLEVVVGDIAADLAAEVRALQVGVAEVEADEDACPVDVFDHVVEAVVALRGRPVTRLSSAKGTLSVPKKASRASTTAVLWQACADGYSGKFGVAPSGRQLGSGTVCGLPSVSASGIAW